MAEKKQKPLFAYLPDEAHDFVDLVKSETGLSKSDFTYLLVLFAQKNWTIDKIKELADNLLYTGHIG